MLVLLAQSTNVGVTGSKHTGDGQLPALISKGKDKQWLAHSQNGERLLSDLLKAQMVLKTINDLLRGQWFTSGYLFSSIHKTFI